MKKKELLPLLTRFVPSNRDRIEISGWFGTSKIPFTYTELVHLYRGVATEAYGMLLDPRPPFDDDADIRYAEWRSYSKQFYSDDGKGERTPVEWWTYNDVDAPRVGVWGNFDKHGSE